VLGVQREYLPVHCIKNCSFPARHALCADRFDARAAAMTHNVVSLLNICCLVWYLVKETNEHLPCALFKAHLERQHILLRKSHIRLTTAGAKTAQLEVAATFNIGTSMYYLQK
jgi:hypothetical protein